VVTELRLTKYGFNFGAFFLLAKVIHGRPGRSVPNPVALKLSSGRPGLLNLLWDIIVPLDIMLIVVADLASLAGEGERFVIRRSGVAFIFSDSLR